MIEKKNFLKIIAPVEGYGEFLVEEVLADTQVERSVWLAITHNPQSPIPSK